MSIDAGPQVEATRRLARRPRPPHRNSSPGGRVRLLPVPAGQRCLPAPGHCHPAVVRGRTAAECARMPKGQSADRVRQHRRAAGLPGPRVRARQTGVHGATARPTASRAAARGWPRMRGLGAGLVPRVRERDAAGVTAGERRRGPGATRAGPPVSSGVLVNPIPPPVRHPPRPAAEASLLPASHPVD